MSLRILLILKLSFFLLENIVSEEILFRPLPQISVPFIKDYPSVVSAYIYPSSTLSNEVKESNIINKPNLDSKKPTQQQTKIIPILTASPKITDIRDYFAVVNVYPHLQNILQRNHEQLSSKVASTNKSSLNIANKKNQITWKIKQNFDISDFIVDETGNEVKLSENLVTNTVQLQQRPQSLKRNQLLQQASQNSDEQTYYDSMLRLIAAAFFTIIPLTLFIKLRNKRSQDQKVTLKKLYRYRQTEREQDQQQIASMGKRWNNQIIYEEYIDD